MENQTKNNNDLSEPPETEKKDERLEATAIVSKVFFYKNPEYNNLPKFSARREWIGKSVGGNEKIVIPRSASQDSIISSVAGDDEHVILPCVLIERERIFSLEEIDLKGIDESSVSVLKKMTGIRDEMKTLRYEVYVLNLLISGARAIEKIEDIVIFFDYQYLTATLKADQNLLDIQYLIDRICSFYTLGARSRNLIRAYIVDFFKQEHRNWRYKDRIEFVEVPTMHDTERENPTDKVIMEKVIREMDEGRITKDSVICLVTGDDDFLTLIKNLRTFGFKIMVAGFMSNTSERMRRNRWVSIFYDLAPVCYPKIEQMQKNTTEETKGDE